MTSYALTDLAALERDADGNFANEWDRLVRDDPMASVFQLPGWCIPWYQCYVDEYQPHVFVVRGDDGGLRGVVPLATDRRSGEVQFAGGAVADYRDIVAAPAHRDEVLARLLEHYLASGFPNPLSLGWLDPASDTPQRFTEACRARGVPFTLHYQPCWRWAPPAPERPAGQKFLKWYTRRGPVSFRVIEADPDWSSFREEYYHQHTLRQIEARRPTAFDDPRRMAFYDRLFHARDVQTLVTGFYQDDVLRAGHFGHVWRRTLLLGPSSVRLEDETRSPAVVLMSWIIQNAETLGLTGFDLTIGDSEYKRRLGNYCVQLTTVTAYRRRHAYLARQTRSKVAATARKVAAALGGDDAWEDQVMRTAARLAHKWARFRELGPVEAARMLGRHAGGAVYERRTGLVYEMTPSELRPVEPAGETAEVEVHENQINDLLLWSGASPTVSALIAGCAQSYAKNRSRERSFHTIVVGGRLAGWGYSYWPSEPAQLTETPGAVLDFPSESVSLYDFYLLPEFRGRRLYQVLLTRILQQRFAEGASRAYIAVVESNLASRKAIERVGFRQVMRNHYRKLFRARSLRSERLAPETERATT